MSDNNACHKTNKTMIATKLFSPLRNCASTPALNSDTKIMTMVDKSTQVNLDCDPGEDPMMNKKYWQDVAGLRGARLEYLSYDLREVTGQYQQLSSTVTFLMSKLSVAEKKIAELKAKPCKCQKEEVYIPIRHDSLGL